MNIDHDLLRNIIIHGMAFKHCYIDEDGIYTEDLLPFESVEVVEEIQKKDILEDGDVYYVDFSKD